MTPPSQKLLQEVEQFVKNIFATRVSPAFVFHNMDHTRDVVKACEEIGRQYSLSEEEELALLIGAWVHDIGYSSGSANQHEEHSQKLAIGFLKEKKATPELIDMVNGCIIATKMPQTPTNEIEQIICDADLYHLGTDSFEEKNRLLRQEINQLQDKEINKKDWRQINIEFLQRQRYFTDYAKNKLEPVKQKNLEKLIAKLSRKEKVLVEEKAAAAGTGLNVNPEKVDPQHALPASEVNKENRDQKEKEKGKEKEKENNNDKGRRELEKQAAENKKTDRSVVAMFRIMSETHVSLSQMADSKANIMISVNTIVISIMVSVLLGKLQFYPEYIIPTILLVLPCLGAVIFAILATRPNITKGTFTKEDIQNKEVNLLFFGNFFRMELPEYDWAMKELMTDKEYLYSSMVKDIYFLGVVLAKKYKLIRISYNIFMFGLIVAIIGFCVAFLVAGQQA